MKSSVIESSEIMLEEKTSIQKTARFWEVDFLRGLAIVTMVIYHTFFIMNYYRVFMTNLHTPFWWYFPRIIANTFIFLVGVSLTLSYSRDILKQTHKKGLYKKYMKRGAMIFACGLFVTFATFIAVRENYVMFGILHLIGASIVLAYPFIRFKYINLLIAALIFSLGIHFKTIFIKSPLLLWIGIKPYNFSTVDFFPIFPWTAAVFIGLFVGNILYNDYKRNFKFFDLSENFLSKAMCYLGEKSLVIYIAHLPIIVGVALLIGRFK
jgi:uncharacterized membrane protein